MTQNIENTYPDWLVSIEIAKKLKEIGFDDPCLITNHDYAHDDDTETNLISFNMDSCSNVNVDILECKFERNSDFKDVHKEYPVNITTIPTWEQVFKWFRDKFKLNIIIYSKNERVRNPHSFDPCNEITCKLYYYEILNSNTEKCLAKSVWFDTYEEARYTAVKTISNKHIEENW